MRQHVSLVFAFLAGGVFMLLASTSPPVIAAGPPDFAGVIARIDDSIVHVTSQLSGNRTPGSRDDAVGAGFVFSPDGLVVTSRHVLRGAQRIFVTVKGRGTFPADVVGQDEVTDVTLLRIRATGLTPLAIGDPEGLRVGDWVLSAGSPFHLAHSWSAGIVSGLHRSQVGVNLKGYEDFIQTDAAANLGNSGGPLVDGSGAAVGMMTAILSRTGQSQGVSLAVPIDVVMDTARRLRTGRPIQRPSLGVVVRERDTRGGGLSGLEITRFQPGSAARAAGLVIGDVILSVDGRAVRRTADLQKAVWAREPGQRATVVFLRGGRQRQVAVPLR